MLIVEPNVAYINKIDIFHNLLPLTLSHLHFSPNTTYATRVNKISASCMLNVNIKAAILMRTLFYLVF